MVIDLFVLIILFECHNQLIGGCGLVGGWVKKRGGSSGQSERYCGLTISEASGLRMGAVI